VEIGTEKKAIIVEPLEDPFAPGESDPEAPAAAPPPEPVEEPAPA
jgi:hypothetical protein